MTAYTWELGIDWNTAQIVPGSFHLAQGFTNPASSEANKVATPWAVNVGDSIAFVIFDLTDPISGTPGSQTFESFVINLFGKALNPLSSLQPGFSREPDTNLATSNYFVNSNNVSFANRSWTSTSPPVMVLDVGQPVVRELLGFAVQMNNGIYTQCFGDDPEMVVGGG